MNEREVIRRHSKSFALAARLLPPIERQRAEALYAWCRTADDQIDQALEPAAAVAALAELRREVEDVYAGRPVSTPAAVALRRVVETCSLPREYPLEMLAGFAMDVAGTRYVTEADLLLYCYRVAGVVGLMMCHALGVTEEEALPHAADLGIAMQLTNIARDVADDWARGRLYLPATWLARSPTPGEPLQDELLVPAVRQCLALAERYYRSGELGFQYLTPRCRFSVRVAARVYQAIGWQIAARGYRPSAGRAVLSQPRKWLFLVRAMIQTLWEGLTPSRLARRRRLHPLPVYSPNFEVQHA
ncbi:MAG: phytoene/squalene synthase family protein [Gemmataceae bacterium]|nr:phytoene/squalene synthase family protein [Gemmata sp.]MDW8199037.1 phytoene/squalene synthase family protein [Gemmataceae bacterium]